MKNLIEKILLGNVEHTEVMRQVWAFLTEEERQEVLAQAHTEKYVRGSMIYSSGCKAHEMLCLVSGHVKVVKDGIAGGMPQIIRILKPLELFGYRAYFNTQVYVTSALACDDCEIIHIPMSVVLHILKENNIISLFIIKHLAEELGFSDNRIISLTQKHVRGRLAEALLTLRNRCGLDKGNKIDVKLSREELASLSNMTTSNAIRTLSAFAQEGLVRLEGKDIVITDFEGLKEISERG